MKRSVDSVETDVSLSVRETDGIKMFGDDGSFHDTSVIELSLTFDNMTVRVGYDEARKLHEKLGTVLGEAAKIPYRFPSR